MSKRTFVAAKKTSPVYQGPACADPFAPSDHVTSSAETARNMTSVMNFQEARQPGMAMIFRSVDPHIQRHATRSAQSLQEPCRFKSHFLGQSVPAHSRVSTRRRIPMCAVASAPLLAQ